MTVIATSGIRISNLIQDEFKRELGYCREVGVVSPTVDTTYRVGTLLGKVTATGKLKEAVETATDGSETVIGIYRSNTAAPGGEDTELVYLARGPVSIKKGGIIWHSSFDTDAKKKVVLDGLTAVGFNFLDTV